MRACATKAERKTWEEQFAADRKEAAEAMRETQMNNEVLLYYCLIVVVL